MINFIIKYIKMFVNRKWLILLFYIIFGLTLYHRSFTSGFIGDDEGQITQNIYIRSLRNIKLFFQGGTFYTGGTAFKLEGSYYRPLMTFSYSLLYSLFGYQAFFFHIYQILLHSFNTFLIFLLFNTLLQANVIAFLFALIFLVHPINVETVIYLADLQDVLFVLFGLCAILFLIKNISKKTLGFSLTFFFLSLLSKEAGILFILTTFIYLDTIAKWKHSYKRFFWGGCALIILLYATLRCYIAHICIVSSNVPIAQLSMNEKLIQIPAVLFFYIKTFFFPKDLFVFQYWIIKKISLFNFYIPLIIDLMVLFILIGIPVIVLLFSKHLNSNIKNKWFTGHIPLSKTYIFFLFWFLIGMVFYSHIIPLDATVADRWFYFPIIGLLGILGVLVQFIKNKRWLYIAIAVWIIILSTRTYIRTLDWKDQYTLFSRDIRKSSDSSSIQNNLGAVLFAQNRIDEAKVHFEKASTLAPENPIFLFNIAQVYERKKNTTKAEYYYKKSIEKGRYYNAFIQYANFLIKNKRDTEALEFLEKKAVPTFPYNEYLQQLYKKLSYEN